MSKFKEAYALDQKAASEGTWVTLRAGFRVKVRYESDPVVLEQGRVLDKKYRSVLMTEGGLPADTQIERDVEMLVRAVVVDWDGCPADALDADGDPTKLLAFSKEHLRALVLAYPELRRDMIYASRMSENFRAAEVEKLKGN